MKLDPLTAVLLALAVYRATVLVTKDYICEPIRAFLRTLGWRRAYGVGDPPRRWYGRHAEYLSTCPWCASIWAAAALVPLTALVSWFVWVDAGLAASAVTGVMFEGWNG